MSRYDYYKQFQTTPQPADGLKAKRTKGKFTQTWWADQWIKALEKIVDAGRLRRGKRYARQGQVTDLHETDNGIAAKVQGSRDTPYRVTIELEQLPDSAWEVVLDGLLERSDFTAQLLAGEMPAEIESVFEEVGVNLFPRQATEIVTDCSCPDWANPCKHVASVYYLLGERFDQDPFMIFRLRGRDQNALLAGLSQRREGAGDSAAEGEISPALSENLDNFWRLQSPLDTFNTTLKPPATKLPILKRLGQPAFIDLDLVRLLEPAHEAITQQAIVTVYGDEPTESES